MFDLERPILAARGARHLQPNWGTCYFDHFARFFRSPTARDVFRRDEETPSIQILGFDGVFPGCRVFASLGLSHFKREVGSIGEVFLPVSQAWDAAPALLAHSLFSLASEEIKLGWGISVAGLSTIDPVFARVFRKAAIYFTNPYGLPQGFGRVGCGNRIGSIYLAVFISQTEHAFFRKHGAARFEKLLDERGVDPYQIDRPSCS